MGPRLLVLRSCVQLRVSVSIDCTPPPHNDSAQTLLVT